MKTSTLTLAALACAASLAGPSMADPAADLATLTGTWQSAAPEPWYGGFGWREFVFADGQWSLTFTHALDPGMAHRTFQFRTGGGYDVGAESVVVSGAYEVDFDEDWKHVTLFLTDPGMVAAFGMGDCGLTPNLEADISASGCAAWQPVEVCGTDHDLLALSDEGLHFGVRPADNDMCTPERRPQALLPAVMQR